jgi:hypothetical protein
MGKKMGYSVNLKDAAFYSHRVIKIQQENRKTRANSNGALIV